MFWCSISKNGIYNRIPILIIFLQSFLDLLDLFIPAGVFSQPQATSPCLLHGKSWKSVRFSYGFCSEFCSYGGWLRNPNHQLKTVVNIPWFIGFQHVSAILLVVQDFAGPSTVSQHLHDSQWFPSTPCWSQRRQRRSPLRQGGGMPCRADGDGDAPADLRRLIVIVIVCNSPSIYRKVIVYSNLPIYNDI